MCMREERLVVGALKPGWSLKQGNMVVTGLVYKAVVS